MKNRILALLCIFGLGFSNEGLHAVDEGENGSPESIIEVGYDLGSNGKEELTPATFGINSDIEIIQYGESLNRHRRYVMTLDLLREKDLFKEKERDNKELHDYLDKERLTFNLLKDALNKGLKHAKLALFSHLLYLEIRDGEMKARVDLTVVCLSNTCGIPEDYKDYQERFDEYNEVNRKTTQNILQAIED